MARRGWVLVVAAAVGLALVSMATNITTAGQLSGADDTMLAARLTVSKLANAGAVWAGLAVLSGWLVRRPLQAVAAGAVGCLVALVTHYGAGSALGIYDADVWASNASWFVAAVVLGGPLGLVGAVARWPDLWGSAARLVVPVASVLDPVVAGAFSTPAVAPWPDRVSSVVCGTVLLAGGTMWLVLGADRLRRRQVVWSSGGPYPPDHERCRRRACCHDEC